MTRLALLALCACAPSAAVTVDATDAPASNPTSDEPALTDCPEPEPPACIPLPIYCGGYAVELCDDERGHAVYVPEATPRRSGATMATAPLG